MPKVSVIIPVYGVEKYIERCARSLFEQTLDDIEYLFIDDCTPDKSIEILKNVLEEYPQRKNQVIIHRMEKNSGQAAVRRWGIENASGDYIIHCDSDDWIDKDMLEKLYKVAVTDGADVVRCYFDRVSDCGTSNCNVIDESIYTDRYKLIEKMFIGNDLSSTCDKLVCRSVYDSISIYPVNNMWEDVVYCTQIMMYSNKISVVPEFLYHYRIHSASIVKNPTLEGTLKRFHQATENVKLIEKIFKGNDKFDCWMQPTLDCLKKRAKNELLPYLTKFSIYNIWLNTFSEINFRILRNPFLSIKGKVAYSLSYVLLNPLIWKKK